MTRPVKAPFSEFPSHAKTGHKGVRCYCFRNNVPCNVCGVCGFDVAFLRDLFVLLAWRCRVGLPTLMISSFGGAMLATLAMELLGWRPSLVGRTALTPRIVVSECAQNLRTGASEHTMQSPFCCSLHSCGRCMTALLAQSAPNLGAGWTFVCPPVMRKELGKTIKSYTNNSSKCAVKSGLISRTYLF